MKCAENHEMGVFSELSLCITKNLLKLVQIFRCPVPITYRYWAKKMVDKMYAIQITIRITD